MLRRWSVLALLMGAVLVAACGSSSKDDSKATTSSGAGAQGSGKTGGTMTYAAESEPDIVNPALAEPDIPSGMIFRGLTRFDKDDKPQPDMATSWETSADKLTYTFKLRPGIKWHDSQAFTADDVKFTLDLIRDKSSSSSNAYDFEQIKSVEVVDPATVRITLTEPFAPLLDKLTIGMVPKHILQGQDAQKAEFNSKPIGTGPFKFVEWRKGEFMTLQANTDFYTGRPKLDKIVLKFVPDASQRLLQLRNGEVDSAFLEPKQVEQFRTSEKVSVYIWPSADYRVIQFNFKNLLFADPKLRTAVEYAVDRDALVKSVLVGYGDAAYGPLQKSDYNNPDVTKFTYDPAKVKSLMTDAGWSLGGDNVWQKDGKKLSLTITAPASDPVRVDIANVVVTSLKNNGIDAKVDPREWSYILKNWATIDLFVLGWGSPFDPDDHTYKLFHSSQALDKGGNNLGSYNNPRIDQILQQARTTLDDGQRKQLYRDFQKELNADPPYVWGVYLQAIYGVTKKIQGPQQRLLGHHGAGFFWNIEEWSMK